MNSSTPNGLTRKTLNEIIFFSHVLICLAIVLIGLRWGKAALRNIIVLNALFANVFVIKQIELFGLTVTASDVYAVGCMLGLNLLQEFHGRGEARKTIKITFFALSFFVLTSQLHLAYLPSVFDVAQSSYHLIFSHAPRILLSSMLCFYLISRMDVLWFGVLKKYFQGKYLGLRIFVSLIFSQLLDTILFSYAALYGILESIWDVILVAFIIKVAIIALTSPLSTFSKKFVRDESEPVSV